MREATLSHSPKENSGLRHRNASTHPSLIFSSKLRLKICSRVVSVVWKSPSERYRRFLSVISLKRGNGRQQGVVGRKPDLLDLWLDKSHGGFRDFNPSYEGGLVVYQPHVRTIWMLVAGKWRFSTVRGTLWSNDRRNLVLLSLEALIRTKIEARRSKLLLNNCWSVVVAIAFGNGSCQSFYSLPIVNTLEGSSCSS
ncbi:hypothetical protein V6N11_026198 [Hibiscus sabdariffa]|uniref:Uncharacterized protein n=1 Tax=Hibiscus sabdariffa TaxID=183260 RepID=A0ABR2SVJ9_9ROSI